MMRTTARFLETVRVGVIAGLAGGLTEVAWIVVYGALSGVSINLVGQEVTRSILPSYSASSSAALIGILIHLILAVGLGISVAFAILVSLRRHDRVYAEYSLVMLTLATVWAVNFLFILPYLNPPFRGSSAVQRDAGFKVTVWVLGCDGLAHRADAVDSIIGRVSV
jgi:hypothetical protein